jgi:hypothetical protein
MNIGRNPMTPCKKGTGRGRWAIHCFGFCLYCFCLVALLLLGVIYAISYHRVLGIQRVVQTSIIGKNGKAVWNGAVVDQHFILARGKFIYSGFVPPHRNASNPGNWGWDTPHITPDQWEWEIKPSQYRPEEGIAGFRVIHIPPGPLHGGLEIVVPLWLPIVLLVIWPTLWFRRGRRLRMKTQRTEKGDAPAYQPSGMISWISPCLKHGIFGGLRIKFSQGNEVE